MKALPGILDGSLVPLAQDDSRACYAKKLDKAEAWIDWSRPAAEIERQVRAFNPWPVAETRLEGQALRIWRAAALGGRRVGAPGTVLAASRDGIDIATGHGVLRVLELQPPGRRAMTVRDFLNARRVDGVTLG
jgi:methionyl-tRNA formyltransferase